MMSGLLSRSLRHAFPIRDAEASRSSVLCCALVLCLHPWSPPLFFPSGLCGSSFGSSSPCQVLLAVHACISCASLLYIYMYICDYLSLPRILGRQQSSAAVTVVSVAGVSRNISPTRSRGGPCLSCCSLSLSDRIGSAVHSVLSKRCQGVHGAGGTLLPKLTRALLLMHRRSSSVLVALQTRCADAARSS